MPTLRITLALTLTLAAGGARASVAHTTGTVQGVNCDIWTWTDSAGKPRTVALKQEGGGNPGHGGYAVQMTYSYAKPSAPSTWIKVTVNAASESDGGFGYFVSHERYRYFSDGSFDTIAGKMFGQDDSPLGLDFPATSALLPASKPTAESFTIGYAHYGTTLPAGFNPNTGQDCGLDASVSGGADCVGLPTNLHAGNGMANYQSYPIQATTTWVFESGKDYPRIDVAVDLSKIIPPGYTMPQAGLVSFDMRGPYGVMAFDNSGDATVTNVQWGDRSYLFAPLANPVTRATGWNWSAPNPGARYALIQTGAVGKAGAQVYEMGLFEPKAAAHSSLVDDYANARGYSSAGYAAAGGTSADQCGDPQTLPSDGEWPYQSIQYSLPCQSQNAGYLTATTKGKKFAWGSSAFYGFNQTSVYDGQNSFRINNFPPSPYQLKYSVCLVLSAAVGAPAPATPIPETIKLAGLYAAAGPVNADCASNSY